MIKKIKCAICGNEFEWSDERADICMFTSPIDKVGLEYYNLWHFPIQRCPECNFASRDISSCENKQIINLPSIKNIVDNPDIRLLDSIKRNNIADYWIASEYYKCVGDQLNECLCLLQAGDLIFYMLFYIQEYYLNEKAEIGEYDKLETLGNELFASGINILSEYLDKNPNNLYNILLVGLLSDSGNQEKIKAMAIIQKLKSLDLNANEKKLLEYVLNDM